MKKTLIFLIAIYFYNTQNTLADKYFICYGEMTKAHQARGFEQRNRLASIKVKEATCKLYANGEINDYEGKGR
ncbi:MAG: hypothetical protein O3A26_00415 [Proteobacteria bacterium]|nr:hypothetical protein [Pseudomonadota bacterium]